MGWEFFLGGRSFSSSIDAQQGVTSRHEFQSSIMTEYPETICLLQSSTSTHWSDRLRPEAPVGCSIPRTELREGHRLFLGCLVLPEYIE
jgi:hypothetical protein